jgi:hypothetical protein
MADNAVPDGYPSLGQKNIAIAIRTALIFLLAWILVRATWPTELIETRLADLTFGGLLFGIFWLLLSVWIAVMLLLYALRLPARKRQIDIWCNFWVWTGLIVFVVYGGAFLLLTNPPRQGFLANIAFYVSAFIWSLVV